MPIQTKDHKKAFIKAVTSKGFHKDTSKSRDVLKIVNYLKSQGIDDERVVYNIISQDIFLEKYNEESQKESFNQGEFIESELNREFKQHKEQLEKTCKELESTKKSANAKEEENQTLKDKKSVLESDVQQYKRAIEKLNKRVKNLEKTASPTSIQEQFNFEAGEANAKVEKEKKKSEELKKKLQIEIEDQIEKEKNTDVRKWQRKVWWNLFWVIPCVLVSLFLILPIDQNPITNQANRFTTMTVIMAPVIYIFLCLLISRFWNEVNIKARKENYKVSDVLKNKLRELE